MPIEFREAWINQAKATIKLAHPDMDDKKLEKKISTIFDERFKDPKCVMENNYIKVKRRTTLSLVATMLINKIVILGGDGCMFVQHSTKLSLLVRWITNLLAERKQLKKLRDTYDKGSDLWRKYDLAQNNKKVMINSLYGILGYMKFHLFNVNLAQSVTSMGQAIISTASCAFENFMSDGIKFVNITELALYILYIKQEYDEKYENNKELFNYVPSVSPMDVAERLNSKVGFNISTEDGSLIAHMLNSLDDNCLKMLYYKNNLEEFLNLEFIRSNNALLLDNIQVLRIGDMSALTHMGEEWNSTQATPDAIGIMKFIIKLIQIFVLYTKQTFDRVRRTRYTDKHTVLYIDTDSNFLSVDMYVRYASTLPVSCIDTDDFRFKSVSIFTIILTMVIAETYKVFTDSLNIAPEYGARLSMKNEFYFPIICFGLAMKRYFGLMMLQEGKQIFGIENQREIKGFDFIKAGTKPFVKNYITKMIDEKILTAENIDTRSIIREVRNFESQIKQSICDGNSSFFRQLTVSPAARYAAPLSNQGFKAVTIWNAISPELVLDFPADVDIIPINLDVGMTDKRYVELASDPEKFFMSKSGERAIYMRNFYYNHPDKFANYLANILHAYDEKTRTLTMNCIAKPRNMMELPDWLIDIIDMNKIITNTIKLINPVIEPLGIPSLKTSSTSSHYSNIVAI